VHRILIEGIQALLAVKHYADIAKVAPHSKSKKNVSDYAIGPYIQDYRVICQPEGALETKKDWTLLEKKTQKREGLEYPMKSPCLPELLICGGSTLIPSVCASSPDSITWPIL